jgi:chromosome partitioning protein
MFEKVRERRPASAHVIVLGNEKGGSGKSTVALHVAISLLKAGQRVATIDLDARQQSITRYMNNRRAWAAHTGLELEQPVHFCIDQGRTMQISDNEEFECQRFIDAAAAVDRSVDFLVIDTPGTDSYLNRVAHSIADTLITPMNDSLLDFDVLGTVEPVTHAVTNVAHYATMVREARQKRRQLDGSTIDWIVVRNRCSGLASRNTRVITGCLRELSLALGFRPIDGFIERSIYREFFLRGLTALDDTEQVEPRMPQNPAQIAARDEVTSLLGHLRLPLDERARRRAANRAEWLRQVGKPLQADELVSA